MLPRQDVERTYLIMPSFVPITFTRSESQLSLRGVGENKPYMMDGLAMKSVQKQTVRGLMSESRDFLSKSFARDNIMLPRVAPSKIGGAVVLRSELSAVYRPNAIHERDSGSLLTLLRTRVSASVCAGLGATAEAA